MRDARDAFAALDVNIYGSALCIADTTFTAPDSTITKINRLAEALGARHDPPKQFAPASIS